MVSEANRLTGVYVGAGVVGLRYQFVAVSWRSALLRREWLGSGDRWFEGGEYVVCDLKHLVVGERGIEMDATACVLMGATSLGVLMRPVEVKGVNE